MSEIVPLTVHALSNGLCLEIFDTSRHYYGGYWRLSLEAHCLVPLSSAGLDDQTLLEDIRRLLGDPVPFVRGIDQMAVPLERVEQTRTELLQRLEGQMIPLTSHPRFIDRFLTSEYRQRCKPNRGIPCLS